MNGYTNPPRGAAFDGGAIDNLLTCNAGIVLPSGQRIYAGSTGSGRFIQHGGTEWQFYLSNTEIFRAGLSVNYTNVDFQPLTDDTRDLGSSSRRFQDVYATNTTIQSSDARLKKDVQDCPLGLNFIEALKPRTFVWRDTVNIRRFGTRTIQVPKTETREREVVQLIDGRYVRKTVAEEIPVTAPQPLYNEAGEQVGEINAPVLVDQEEEFELTAADTDYDGPVREEVSTQTHRRHHAGLIAQEVKEALEAVGVDPADVAAYIDPAATGKPGHMGIRYGELIAPMLVAIQELSRRLQTVEGLFPKRLK